MNTSSKTPGLFRRLTYKIPIFRSLKAVGHDHGSIISERRKHVRDSVHIEGRAVVLLKLGNALSAGSIAGAVDGAFEIFRRGIILDGAEAVKRQIFAYSGLSANNLQEHG